MILYQFGFLIENELLCQLERFKKRVIKTIIIKQFKALWAVKFHSLKTPTRICFAAQCLICLSE